MEELCGQAGSAAGGAQTRIGESAALAYGPFVAALGDEAGLLLVGDDSGDMLAARRRLFVRVLGLLAALASRSPLVLEDLHWADDFSRELLAFLAVRLHAEPVLVARTLCEDELGEDAGGGSPSRSAALR